jgi:hypothetical protein
MGRPLNHRMPRVTYKGNTYLWNGFSGFFFLPVGPKRKRERLVKEGTRLYETLRRLAGYP